MDNIIQLHPEPGEQAATDKPLSLFESPVRDLRRWSDIALRLACDELNRLEPGKESHAFLVIEHLAELARGLEKLWNDVFSAQHNGGEQ